MHFDTCSSPLCYHVAVGDLGGDPVCAKHLQERKDTAHINLELLKVEYIASVLYLQKMMKRIVPYDHNAMDLHHHLIREIERVKVWCK